MFARLTLQFLFTYICICNRVRSVSFWDDGLGDRDNIQRWKRILYFVSLAAWLSFLHAKLKAGGKHSFPSRISQNYLLWLDIPKKHIWEKGRFFCQKPWANRFAKFRFVWFFSNFIIPVQETFFILLRVSKNVLLWLHIAKNPTWKKVDFWQKPWTNPFANFLFFGLFSNFSIPV